MQNKYSNMDKLFRDKLENHEVQVDAFVWQSIQDEFTEISSYKKNWLRYLSYAAIFFLTIGFTIASSQQYFNYANIQNQQNFDQDNHIDHYYSYLINTQSTTAPKIITQKVEVPKEIYKFIEVPVEITKYVSNPELENILSKYQNFNYSAEELTQLEEKIKLIQSFNLAALPENTKDEEIDALSSINMNELVAEGNESTISLQNIEHEIVLSELNALGMALDGSGSYSYKSEITTQQLVDNILRKKMTNLKGFQIGLCGTFFNSWILNKRPAEISTNSLLYKFTTGGQYGVTVGYNFNPRLGLEMSLAKANQGQRIIHYTDAAKEIENEVRLDYIHMPLAFKYKWEQYSSITKNPIVMNYLFGLQYSKLLSIDGIMNNDIMMLEDLQRTHDIGFLVGLDYDIFLGNNYFVTIGARSTFGTDINAFVDAFNGASNTKTDNFTVGLKASFNYLFRMN